MLIESEPQRNWVVGFTRRLATPTGRAALLIPPVSYSCRIPGAKLLAPVLIPMYDCILITLIAAYFALALAELCWRIWIEKMGEFIERPLLEIAESGQWITEGRTVYISDKYGQQTVPDGFKTDLASIPNWVPRFIADPAGKSRLPAIVHDWICRNAQSREERVRGDHIFLEAMKSEGVPAWRRWLMFIAVRGMSAVKRKFP